MTRDLEELRFVDEADVFKAGALAARMQRLSDSVLFSYTQEHIAAGAPAVATTLPVSEEAVRTHSPGALPPFFSGLLPEGRRITALRRAVKTSADDELSLLLAVGGDVIGDVQVVPAGEAPAEAAPQLTVTSWGDVRFGDLDDASTGWGGVDRVGIPGVQDKVSARMINVPVATADRRYILKLDPPEYPHVVENEAFFLRAATASGISAAEGAIVHDADGRAGLLVTRFDRISAGDGLVRSRGQEDGCQVLGRYPADKYNLSAEQVVSGLVAVTRARPVAARDLLRQVVFAYLTCNGDAHAKNFSVCQAGDGEWSVTPAYDVPTTHPYGDVTVSLRVGGKSREDIGRADFLALAAVAGLRERPAARVIDDLVDAAPLWMDRLDELPFDERRLHKLERAMGYRRSRLTARSS